MIRHILKNGEELQDITGHIVKREDAETAYQVLEETKHDTDERGA